MMKSRFYDHVFPTMLQFGTFYSAMVEQEEDKQESMERPSALWDQHETSMMAVSKMKKTLIYYKWAVGKTYKNPAV